eukprot:gene572-97_t
MAAPRMELLGPVQEACETAFDVYAKGNLLLEWNDFPKLWRAVGENPTNQEITDMIARHKKEDSECFTKEEWISLCEVEQPDDTFREDALVEAFRQFDTTGSGLISVPKFRQILLVYGDHLPDDMADAFVSFAVSNASTEDGMLDYLELIPQLKRKDGKAD